MKIISCEYCNEPIYFREIRPKRYIPCNANDNQRHHCNYNRKNRQEKN